MHRTLHCYLKIGVSNLVGLSVGSIEVDPISKVRNIIYDSYLSSNYIFST